MVQYLSVCLRCDMVGYEDAAQDVGAGIGMKAERALRRLTKGMAEDEWEGE